MILDTGRRFWQLCADISVPRASSTIKISAAFRAVFSGTIRKKKCGSRKSTFSIFRGGIETHVLGERNRFSTAYCWMRRDSCTPVAQNTYASVGKRWEGFGATHWGVCICHAALGSLRAISRNYIWLFLMVWTPLLQHCNARLAVRRREPKKFRKKRSAVMHTFIVIVVSPLISVAFQTSPDSLVDSYLPSLRRFWRNTSAFLWTKPTPARCGPRVNSAHCYQRCFR